MTKITQIVSRYDNAVIALTSAGQVFELSNGRGEWQPVAGIEGERIVSLAVRHTGALVATTLAGRVFEQHRVGAVMGDHSQAWRPLPSLPA